MPPPLESSLALSEPRALKQRPLILDVSIVNKSPARSTAKAVKPRTYGDGPLPFKPSAVAPRDGRIVGRVAEFGKIPVYKLRLGDTEINGIKLWEILDYISPLELERYENEQFKEEAAALDAARAAAEAEKERRRAKQAEKARQRGLVLSQEAHSGNDEADADDPDTRRGRARPTYTHLFKKPFAERRRRRKRDPDTGELLPLSDDDADALLPPPTVEPPKRRRRKRNPVTGELMPFSDRGDGESSSSGDEGQTSTVSLPAPSTGSQPKRRRRKRDPVTGELLPLSDRGEDLERDGVHNQSAGRASAPGSAAPPSRRRKRDPHTGELMPLQPVAPQGKWPAQDPGHKRRRRRRHPDTGELMPLGWRLDPNAKPKLRASAKDLMTPAMRQMSISHEHESKRIKLASSSSDDPSRNRTPSSTPLRGAAGKPRFVPHMSQRSSFPSETDELDELARDDGDHRPVSASKSRPTVKTSITHPTQPDMGEGASSDTDGEPITLESFLRASGQNDDSDSQSPRPHVPPSPSTRPASSTNPTATQQSAHDTDEDGDALDEDEWVVDCIVAHRMSDPKSHPGRKPVMLYHTKWENSSELTWEPFDSFTDPSVVLDYRRRVGLDKSENGSENKGENRSENESENNMPSTAPEGKEEAKEPSGDSGDDEGEGEDDDEEVWEVESILAHHLSDPRTHPGQPQTMLYKVKWAGWKNHTWEPPSSFPDKAVLNAYRRKAGMSAI